MRQPVKGKPHILPTADAGVRVRGFYDQRVSLARIWVVLRQKAWIRWYRQHQEAA